MFALLFNILGNLAYLLASPVGLMITAFQLWMLVHALRNREWIWAVFIVIGSGLSAILYFFMVYRAAPSATRGFELPGAGSRRPRSHGPRPGLPQTSLKWPESTFCTGRRSTP